ncbi:hypothetical protein DNTS_034504 [Danionella cerebrum]|uniref:Uncharacterized protein n=1 Tax=Danionella cerebrum TaxID=2873325 RepID=A0A553MLP6_9TELE|nr:hypothetical protein DNTS_034504 [Danionella translucida]
MNRCLEQSLRSTTLSNTDVSGANSFERHDVNKQMSKEAVCNIIEQGKKNTTRDLHGLRSVVVVLDWSSSGTLHLRISLSTAAGPIIRPHAGCRVSAGACQSSHTGGGHWRERWDEGLAEESQVVLVDILSDVQTKQKKCVSNKTLGPQVLFKKPKENANQSEINNEIKHSDLQKNVKNGERKN